MPKTVLKKPQPPTLVKIRQENYYYGFDRYITELGFDEISSRNYGNSSFTYKLNDKVTLTIEVIDDYYHDETEDWEWGVGRWESKANLILNYWEGTLYECATTHTFKGNVFKWLDENKRYNLPKPPQRRQFKGIKSLYLPSLFKRSVKFNTPTDFEFEFYQVPELDGDWEIYFTGNVVTGLGTWDFYARQLVCDDLPTHAQRDWREKEIFIDIPRETWKSWEGENLYSWIAHSLNTMILIETGDIPVYYLKLTAHIDGAPEIDATSWTIVDTSTRKDLCYFEDVMNMVFYDVAQESETIKPEYMGGLTKLPTWSELKEIIKKEEENE